MAESPDDDRPRLVYADWLLARGDPRGELIQIQCARAGQGYRARPDLQRRELELLREHGERWLAEVGLEEHEGAFRRGFIEDVVVDPDRLAALDAGIDKGLFVRHLRIG